MSLRDKLNTKLAGAWSKLDDVPVPAVLNHTTGQTYDPNTGAQFIVDSFPCDVVLSVLTEEQTAQLSGGNGTHEILARLEQLPMVAVVGDAFVVDGVTYDITATDVDPARVLLTATVTQRGAIDSGLKNGQ